jgi:hypothetical protein
MGATAATRIDVERLRADGTAEGPAQSVPKKDTVTTPATARFDVPPGKCTLRFTSFDANGEVLDRWPEDVVVPPMNGALALATPRFFLARSAFELRAVQSTQDIAPAATRRVRKTDRLVVEIEFYSSGGTPELIAELLNQKGDSLVTLPLSEPANSKSRFEIPLQSLAPAVYVLKVTAQTADKDAQQFVPFRIVP